MARPPLTYSIPLSPFSLSFAPPLPLCKSIYPCSNLPCHPPVPTPPALSLSPSLCLYLSLQSLWSPPHDGQQPTNGIRNGPPSQGGGIEARANSKRSPPASQQQQQKQQQQRQKRSREADRDDFERQKVTL